MVADLFPALLFRRPALLLLFGAVVPVSGCNVVDESEITASDIAFLDRCEADPLLAILSSSSQRRVDFSLVNNDTNSSGTACGLSDLVGPEGYFVFSSLPSQRWRIRAQPTGADADVAVYVNQGCQGDVCLAAKDRCGPGLPEAFTFIAPTGSSTGQEDREELFSLVVDTRGAYEGDVDVSLSRSICGDGVVDPGEACDPLSPSPGDGCSLTCARELDLRANSVEVESEPNEEPATANVLLLPGASEFTSVREVAGRAGGVCDEDVHLLEFGAGGSVTGRQIMVSLGGSCAASPEVRLTILSSIGGRVVDLVQEQFEAGSCPSLVQTIEPARSYYIQLTAVDDTVAQFDYTVDVELMPML